MVCQASLGVEKTTTGTAPVRFVALGGWDIKIETQLMNVKDSIDAMIVTLGENGRYGISSSDLFLQHFPADQLYFVRVHLNLDPFKDF